MWIFVSVMTCSQYAFVKAYIDQKTNNWIKAHVQMFASVLAARITGYGIYTPLEAGPSEAYDEAFLKRGGTVS